MRSESEVKKNEALKTILKGGTPEKDPKVFLNYNKERETPDREVGDTWTDDKGNKWEQKDGYKINHGKSDRPLSGKPLFCPECGGVMNKQIDQKMWYRTNMCSDCVIERETKMRALGVYDLYEKQKVLDNMKSWYRDIKEGAEDFFDSINNQEFVNSFGIEDWSELDEEKVEEMKSNAKEEFDRIENKIDEIEGEVKELREDSDVEEVSLQDIEV